MPAVVVLALNAGSAVRPLPAVSMYLMKTSELGDLSEKFNFAILFSGHPSAKHTCPLCRESRI
jgi:hypothetical protein